MKALPTRQWHTESIDVAWRSPLTLPSPPNTGTRGRGAHNNLFAKKTAAGKTLWKPATANDGPYSCREIPGRALPGRWWRTRRLWVFFLLPVWGEELVSDGAVAGEATIACD